MEVCGSVVFNIFSVFHNHHHNLILEHFITPQNFISISTNFFIFASLPLQPLATTISTLSP